MAETYKDFPLHNDTKDFLLKAWNRYNTLMNLRDITGNSENVKEYLEKFPYEERVMITSIRAHVLKYGYEETERNIIRKQNA